jgi:hypothetical protein
MGVRLRAGPGLNWSVTGHLSEPAVVRLRQWQGDWAQVDTGAALGWVWGAHLIEPGHRRGMLLQPCQVAGHSLPARTKVLLKRSPRPGHLRIVLPTGEVDDLTPGDLVVREVTTHSLQ